MNEVLQEAHYYAFGMEMEELSEMVTGGENKYRYNGKEWNEDFGLNWMDFGWRWYDPALGRFTGVDPVSDKYPDLSVYNYAGNSPIANIDLWGLQPIGFDIRLDQNVKEVATGKITKKEYLDRLKAEGQGGLAGASMISPVDEVSIGIGLLGKTKVRSKDYFYNREAKR